MFLNADAVSNRLLVSSSKMGDITELCSDTVDKTLEDHQAKETKNCWKEFINNNI